MIFDLGNEYDAPKFIEYAKKLLEQRCVVTLSKKPERRTIQQNKYLHLILGWFGCEIGLSVEEVKIDYFKRLVNREIFERERVNKKGKTVRYLRSSATLDTKEMTTAIDRFRNWSSSVAGVYLPSADEQNYLNHIEKEMEKNKEFI